jgi:hypothetical protein
VTRSRDEVEADLRTVGAEWQAVSARMAELRADRIRLFREARTLVPPIEHFVSGKHFGVIDRVVQKVMREADRMDARAGNGSG